VKGEGEDMASQDKTGKDKTRQDKTTKTGIDKDSLPLTFTINQRV
jgi:hypothetical protein